MDKKIIFTVRINLPSKLTVSDFDISVLLGNLLENAIEAASHASEAERLILLNIISSGKMLAITVDNGFDGHVNLDGDKYLSTKKRHTGIGLKSITNIAEKYNGGVQFSHEETIFHASVMLGT